MNLYHLKGQTLASIAHDAFALERDLHQMIEANLDMLFGLKLVSSEFGLGEFRLDTLAYDEEQRLTLKRGAVNWSSSKVIFISPSFSRYQKSSVNFKDIPFELWEVRRFDGRVISVDQVQAASKESVKQLTKSEESSVISEVSSEVIVYREEDYTANASPALLEIWEGLRAGLDDWPDGSFYAKKPYIGFKRNNRSVCFIHFRKDRISFHLSRGEKQKDGQRKSKFFDLNDYKKMAKEKCWNYRDGRTGHMYVLILKQVDDVPYALDLISQKFKSL